MGIEPDEDEILIRRIAESAMASRRAKLESDWMRGRGLDLLSGRRAGQGRPGPSGT